METSTNKTPEQQEAEMNAAIQAALSQSPEQNVPVVETPVITVGPEPVKSITVGIDMAKGKDESVVLKASSSVKNIDLTSGQIIKEKKYKITEVLDNKDIKCIRNINAPAGCFVELHRNAEGKVTLINTYFVGKKNHGELPDHKSLILKSTSNDWIEFDPIPYMKQLEEDAKKPKVANPLVATKR